MSETQTETEIKNDVHIGKSTNSTSASSATEVLKKKIPQNLNESNSKIEGENVDAVVTKAKRAATFLWILLHAQVCKTCEGQCPHRGCGDAKRLLLHIKTCSAKNEYVCPTCHPGCQQARKLLSHYRKCKEIRARQRRLARFNEQTNFCLICTLLARHDKSISEKSSLSITSPLPVTSHKKTNTTNSLSSSFEKIYSPQVNRRKARSKSVQFDLIHRESKCADIPVAMPPPPPRARTASVGSIPALNVQKYPFNEKDRNRPRAESLDESKRHSNIFGNDPTIEMELREQKSDEALEVRRIERQLPFRKRSVSCSLIQQMKSTGCETIMEE